MSNQPPDDLGILAGGASEEPSSLVGRSIGLAVTTTKQKQYDFCRQMLNLMLQSVQVDRVRHARVTNNRVGAEAEMTDAYDCNVERALLTCFRTGASRLSGDEPFGAH